MKRGPVIAEIAAWTLFFPVAFVLMLGRLLGYGRKTTEDRVAALLAWYPPSWREQHGDGLATLLRDAIGDGRGGFLMAVDVAREGVIERARALRWDYVRASLYLTLGWIMLVPQGLVAPVLGAFGAPPTWFVALHVDGDVRWLVTGFMVGVGALLLERGLHVLGMDCVRRNAYSAG